MREGSSIRVVVLGALGRVGSVVAKAVAAEQDMELVAGVDSLAPQGSSADPGPGSVLPSLEDLKEDFDVAVDFTTGPAVLGNARRVAERGAHLVVGATGIPEEDQAQLAELFPGPPNALVVPNFSIGAVLMMRFAVEAARFMPYVEVIELHHEAKADAPSGTAVLTARRIGDALAAARRPERSSLAPPQDEGMPSRGVRVSGIPVHSVRLPGLLAHQEVILGEQGQTLTIRHDVIDRTAFVPGVLMAVRAVPGLPGLNVGLERVLFGDGS
jgi:4-hydroxy-tetrahydrodipicolinate reductase